MAILPNKAMCRVDEAARLLGCSTRKIQQMIAEGRLLAINVSGSAKAGGRRWRVVVRREAAIPRQQGNVFLSLEEFIQDGLSSND